MSTFWKSTAEEGWAVCPSESVSGYRPLLSFSYRGQWTVFESEAGRLEDCLTILAKMPVILFAPIGVHPDELNTVLRAQHGAKDEVADDAIVDDIESDKENVEMLSDADEENDNDSMQSEDEFSDETDVDEQDGVSDISSIAGGSDVSYD